MAIKFEDFFEVDYPEKTKVKFNMNSADITKLAYDNLMANEDDDTDDDWINMNAHRKKQSNNNLDKADYLLTFAQYYPYGPDFYIFGGMYKVTKKSPEVINGKGYDLELVPDFYEYRKRLIIKLEKPIGRDLYNRLYVNVQSKLNPEIYTIFPSAKLGNFPGYNNVLLKHKDLQTIFNQEAPEWKDALSSVKGVYCITDTSTGQLYIGSASGVGGIWQRWSSYADVDNLTGGNKAFEQLKKGGADHIINNFTYSILEIFDPKTKNDEILKRESYWKDVFQSRKYGMNEN